MNELTTDESQLNMPLKLVCDDACVRLLKPLGQTLVLDLSAWMQAGSEVDVLICDAKVGTDFIKIIRRKAPSALIVVVVQRLRGSTPNKLLDAGADELITRADFSSGRLELIVGQHAERHLLSTQQQYRQAEHMPSLSVLAGKSSANSLVVASHSACPVDKAENSVTVASACETERTELARRNTFMTALSDVSMRLLERKSVDELMDHIATQAASLAKVESAFVSKLHKCGRYMEIVGAVGRFVEFKGFRHARDEDVVGKAWENAELVLSNGSTKEQLHAELWGGFTERCAVPFYINHQVGGVVCLALDDRGGDRGDDRCVDAVQKEGAIQANDAGLVASDVADDVIGDGGADVLLNAAVDITSDISDDVAKDGLQGTAVELASDVTKDVLQGTAVEPAVNDFSHYLEVLKLFTRTVSIAIENANLINEQEAELARHKAIGEITQSFYSAHNLRELIDSVCKSLLSVFNSKHATVCRVANDGKYALLAEWQKTEQGIQRANFANVKLMSHSISQWCVENKQPGLVRKDMQDDRDSAAVQKIRNLLGIGCSIALPLMQDEQVWGVLELGKSNGQKDFSDVELSLLELLTSQLSNSVMRQNLLDKVHFQAFHDSLTQLPNRLKFENTLDAIVSSDKAGQQKFALLFLDLDGFKAVNDNQGHSVGDELLKQVSKRLACSLQDKDLLARMGGDEFAVLLRGVKSRESALSIAKRLSKAIGQKFIVGKYNLKIGVSIGLSFYPENGETVDDLLRNADFAMYEAKAVGNSCVRSFNQEMAEQYRLRLVLENDLHSAIENRQFELFYQPKVDVVRGEVFGVEALLRWKHPVHGYVSPNDFVSIAEEAGYITEIGQWVLNQAIYQSAKWNEKGWYDLSMAVNISSPQFGLDDFASGVFETLGSHGLDPAQLELEVTETVVMNSLSNVVSTLNELREQGVSIAIDDFGTGYSSLIYLEQLPLDCMKIDKLFIDKIIAGAEQKSMAYTILAMAKALGLKTIAEGVENEDQLKRLLLLGCECVQGYYFSKPIAANDVPHAIDTIERHFHKRRKVG